MLTKQEVDLKLNAAAGRLEPGARPMFDEAMAAMWRFGAAIDPGFYELFADSMIAYLERYPGDLPQPEGPAPEPAPEPKA